MVTEGLYSMRGTDVHQEGQFSYLSPESRIPRDHPLRAMVNEALAEVPT